MQTDRTGYTPAYGIRTGPIYAGQQVAHDLSREMSGPSRLRIRKLYRLAYKVPVYW